MSEGTPRVALIQFPGSNCEWETKRAAEVAGLSCDVFRWNRDPALLADYDGYIIGGGFSYQDRIRSGVIATKEPIVKQLFGEVTDKGKPCIGICNGAQVLVEAGLIPGINRGKVEMALAPNFRDPQGRIAGFCCRWVYLKHACKPGRNVFSALMPEGMVWPVPIAHGEGRYTTKIADLLDTLHANDQIVFQYCDADGNVDPDRAINPNGALDNIAALCNPEGNVVAIMPHPERASFLRQIPGELDREWGDKKVAAWGDLAAIDGAGPGRLIFEAMAKALDAVPA